ncbi:MAG: hypothetical protein U0414_02715 [Polyangiaceae bacterium]
MTKDPSEDAPDEPAATRGDRGDVAPSFPRPEATSPFRRPAPRREPRVDATPIVVSRPEPPPPEVVAPRARSPIQPVAAERSGPVLSPRPANPVVHFIAHHPRLAGGLGFLLFGPLSLLFASAASGPRVVIRRGLPPVVWMHASGALAFAALWLFAVQVPTNEDPNDSSIAGWWKAGLFAFAIGGGLLIKFAEFYFKS